jgi:A/G-specific adenine glycosylase
MRAASGPGDCLVRAEDLSTFRRSLLAWFHAQQRDLPWRRTRDPYAIWVSEIMLQQTRVAAVIPYYERFLQRFPNFAALAQAPESELLACWAGLGYYYRARNLQKAAQRMHEAGLFPREYASIRELPGIGDYTAAAIASISFDLPHAVVDGNVLRVLSRVCADSANTASNAGKKHFTSIANILLDVANPGAFNQAVMELGAVVCLPKNPQCLVCPVPEWCLARERGEQNKFPVKIVTRKSETETRTLFWVQDGQRILAWQRPPASRLMPGFWELPEKQQLPFAQLLSKLGSFRHGITFHNYVFDLWTATTTERPSDCVWIEISGLKELPVSTILKKAARLVDVELQAKATVRAATASGT